MPQARWVPLSAYQLPRTPQNYRPRQGGPLDGALSTAAAQVTDAKPGNSNSDTASSAPPTESSKAEPTSSASPTTSDNKPTSSDKPTSDPGTTTTTDSPSSSATPTASSSSAEPTSSDPPKSSETPSTSDSASASPSASASDSSTPSHSKGKSSATPTSLTSGTTGASSASGSSSGASATISSGSSGSSPGSSSSSGGSNLGAIIGGAAGGAAALAAVAFAIFIMLRRRKRRQEQVDWLIMQKQERFPSDTDVVLDDDPLPSPKGFEFDDDEEHNPYATVSVGGASYPRGNQYYDHSYPYGPVGEYPTTHPEEYYSSMFGQSHAAATGTTGTAGTYDDPFADQRAYDMYSYPASQAGGQSLPTATTQPAPAAAPAAQTTHAGNPYVGLV